MLELIGLFPPWLWGLLGAVGGGTLLWWRGRAAGLRKARTRDLEARARRIEREAEIKSQVRDAERQAHEVVIESARSVNEARERAHREAAELRSEAPSIGGAEDLIEEARRWRDED